MKALKHYRQHITDQYADRCAFWALKDISAELMSRTLTLTTDGADQAIQTHYMAPFSYEL